MKTVKIIWDGEQRELPGVGVLSKGDGATVPENVAQSLKDQGLAHFDKSKQEKAK